MEMMAESGRFFSYDMRRKKLYHNDSHNVYIKKQQPKKQPAIISIILTSCGKMSKRQRAAKGCECDCVDLKHLLESGANVNDSDQRGWTAVMYAARDGKLPCLKTLVEYGACLAATNKEGDNVLMIAVLNNRVTCSRYLMQNRNCSMINQQNRNGLTALMCAAKYGYINHVKLLLEFKAVMEMKHSNKYTALMFALKHGKFEAANLLIEAGASSKVRAKDGKTPLILAAKLDTSDCVEKLLQAGADTEAQGYGGLTALQVAVICRNVEAMSLLLKYKANVDAADARGITSLMLATKHRGVYAIELLLQAGANVDLEDCEGQTALMNAVTNNNDAAADVLLSHGANVNASTPQGRTALMMAVSSGRTARFVKILLKYDVDLDLKDTIGYTALLLALEHDHYSMAKMLIEAGAQVNVASVRGTTPLTKVLFETLYGDQYATAMVQHLLHLGADLGMSERDQVYLHKMIDVGNTEFIHKMIINGCPPLLVSEYHFLNSWNYLPQFDYLLSPLEVALLSYRPQVARYLLSINFLTWKDLVEVPKSPRILQLLSDSVDIVSGHDRARANKVITDTQSVVRYLCESPRSLFTLSLVAVSTTLGPDRHSSSDHPVEPYHLFFTLHPDKANLTYPPSLVFPRNLYRVGPPPPVIDLAELGLEEDTSESPSKLDTTCDDQDPNPINKTTDDDALTEETESGSSIEQPEDSQKDPEVFLDKSLLGLTRKEKVQRLPLPAPLKRVLMFETPAVKVPPEEWGSISL